MNPYVGITDFTSIQEVRKMYEVFRANRKKNSERKLHIGVMMSYKTLHGIETKWSKAFPPKDKIYSIFGGIGLDTYNCLHYADYDKQTRYTDFCLALEYAGTFVDAFQLDMPWPDPGMIASGIHASRKNVEVILQVGAKSITEANNAPEEVVRRLKDYDGVIHRVLLDKSMGRGLGMDSVELAPFARAIKKSYPDLGLVFAGGLGPDTLNLLGDLPKEFPDLSIDAQGKLRPSDNALDPIDWNMAGDYLAKALQLLP